jgi:nucleotide-binding universal stress UspA family protein
MTRQSPLVLLAASGSEASRRAAVVAADLASTFDAQLTILHVASPLAYRVGPLALTLPITRRLDDPLTSPVLPEAPRNAWAHGASANTLLIAGDPARVIVAIADERGADLLVIGSRPRLMPSVLAAQTRRWVTARAPCPALPVTPDRRPPARPATEPILAA